MMEVHSATRRERRFRLPARTTVAENKFTYVSIAIMGLIVVAGAFAPVIAPYDPVQNSADTLQAPSAGHLFGTDQFGRDVFSRVLWGARPTLIAAVAGIGISAGFGVPLGLLAGYFRRWFSGVIMRAMDVLLAFPAILLALVIVAVIGSGVFKVAIAIGISFIPIFARITYGSTLATKQQDYVTSARVIGARPRYIMARHILPNVSTQIVVVASSAFGWAILQAGTLNFLGFGVHLPTPDWGADLAAGQEWLESGWWISTFPGIAITLTILVANYIGDHVASALEPGGRTAVQVPGIEMGGLRP